LALARASLMLRFAIVVFILTFVLSCSTLTCHTAGDEEDLIAWCGIETPL
jgi:hypothetical protein